MLGEYANWWKTHLGIFDGFIEGHMLGSSESGCVPGRGSSAVGSSVSMEGSHDGSSLKDKRNV